MGHVPSQVQRSTEQIRPRTCWCTVAPLWLVCVTVLNSPSVCVGCCQHVVGQSTAVSSSPSPSRHNLHTSGEDEEEEEEPHTQALVEREHSFEDLEQFLTNLDWTPPEGSRIDDLCSDSNVTFDPAVLKECQVQELEMRALKEHLKAVVKDIHIAIGEWARPGLQCVQ